MALPNSALIIDDEPHVRVYAVQILRDAGISLCLEAADGETGLKVIREQKPELILIDLNLSGILSGMDVLKQIRGEDDMVYAVIFTCEASSAAVMAAVNAGADGFIRKDTSPKEIVRQLLEIVADSDDEE
ncbi:MAG: response regulator [Opitutaceae bacterium]|nr:response regulator [Opitutaceae bacterium]